MLASTTLLLLPWLMQGQTTRRMGVEAILLIGLRRFAPSNAILNRNLRLPLSLSGSLPEADQVKVL